MGSFAVPGASPLGRGRVQSRFQQRTGIPQKTPLLRRQHLHQPVLVQAKGARDPPDTPKEQTPSVGREWLQTLLSRFGPITEKAQNTAVLDFEKPLVELDNRIKEVRKLLSSLFRALRAEHIALSQWND